MMRGKLELSAINKEKINKSNICTRSRDYYFLRQPGAYTGGGDIIHPPSGTGVYIRWGVGSGGNTSPLKLELSAINKKQYLLKFKELFFSSEEGKLEISLSLFVCLSLPVSLFLSIS